MVIAIKCEKCGKIIRSLTEAQASFNMGVHKLTHAGMDLDVKGMDKKMAKENIRNATHPKQKI